MLRSMTGTECKWIDESEPYIYKDMRVIVLRLSLNSKSYD